MTGPLRWLLRASVPRPLVVTAPGGTASRLAVERVLRESGVRRALGPSEADTLVECGPAGTALDEAADRVWDQMSEPRARVRVEVPAQAATRLDEARAALLDASEQRRAAARRAVEPGGGGDQQGAEHTPAHDADAEPGTDDGGDHADAREHGEHDGEHDGHHGHPDMELPGGLVMADRGDDRDGLRLDRLHIAFGPVQADWPAGLVAELTVQGDVVQDARVSTLSAPPGVAAFWDHDARAGHGLVPERIRAAAAADSLQRLLAVAGWPDAAATGRLLRDTLLAPDAGVTGRVRFTRWLRRVRGSRLLRWSLRGLGPAPDELPERLRGDVPARMARWLDDIAAVLVPDTFDTFLAPPIQRRSPRRARFSARAGRRGREPGDGAAGAAPPATAASAAGTAPEPPPLGRERAVGARAAVDVLPRLLVGQELAAVRLIVASFDPDVEALAAYPAAVPPPHHAAGGPAEDEAPHG
ncbi:hypothetical protein [Streptomonospora litoralis]|uniref:hypothetical protein n=1 Tax=Streptomonospora litoralis TaxID=2498135 RepID=UPI001A954F26|nr:hypothetical protein [Streptomonospora litoralis]